MLKKKSTDQAKEDPVVDNSKNPYLDARREWNERYGSYIKQAKNWRAIAFMSSFIALIAVSGVVYIGSESKLVPYVVEVDKLGQQVPVQRADRASSVSDAIIIHQLASWIESSRTVFTDADAQNKMIGITYSMLRNKSPAYNKANAYFQQNNPFARAADETVSVDIKSVLPMSKNTWRVEWVEKKHDREGMLVGSTNMQAILTVGITPPQDESAILINPMGVYIDDFSWSAKL